ncbi:MAG: glyoxylate/hydroxypyruvate reductase A [Betaproteobacteria bacterium]|nr:glyoxylate/hydroxypyruvate reductase A [Betaproteobacteria bacterium]
MDITFCCADTNADEWLPGLRAALPEANITLWQAGAPPARYAIVWQPPRQFFTEQPQLRALFNMGAGVDALMGPHLSPNTLVVRLNDAGMADQMAEYVCHALIRHFRAFAAYDQDMAQRQWTYREPLPRAQFPVGVMGLGALGERVARAVGVFGFPVRGWSRSAKQIAGVECFSGSEGFTPFLQGTRVLVNMLPLTAETENILNRATLSQLQPGALLINVARGRHLVEEDLQPLLDGGQLAAAVLDVFRQEPLPADHPFWSDARITITPHTAARTLFQETVAQISGKLRALERGEAIAGVVDMQRGY